MWNEVIQTTTYLLNRSYTTALNNVTPAEMWFGFKPDISNLRVFGCKAYLIKPNHTRNKFNEKSELFILIGITLTDIDYETLRTEESLMVGILNSIRPTRQTVPYKFS